MVASIEILRRKLHTAIKTGVKQEILAISRELDNEIVKFMMNSSSVKVVKDISMLQTVKPMHIRDGSMDRIDGILQRINIADAKDK